MSNDNELSVEDNAEDVENTGTNIWNHYKIDGAQLKLAGTKNIRCIFSNTVLTESLSVVHLELSPISLVELFLLKRKQMLELVFQNVKRMIINI